MTSEVLTQRSGSRPIGLVVAVVGLAAIPVFVVMLLGGMDAGNYESWGTLILVPVLLGLSIPALARQARREGDRTLLWILLAALVLKLLGAFLRHYFAFDVYGGVADAADYHEVGASLSERFRTGDFTTDLDDLGGTNFIRFLTGLVYALIGVNQIGGFLFYSWLGFWGLFSFYRAYTIAVPEGNNRAYARLVFFLPSLIFWPSSIGKESWMMLTIGLVALGSARILTGSALSGAVPLALGLWLGGVVRPHVAGMLAVALGVSFVFRKSRAELRELAPIVRGLTLVCLAAVAIFLVVKADAFLKEAGIDTDKGVSGALEDTTERTSTGGSQFAPSVLESPARAPIAVVTVLYRPFIFEAHNAESLIAAVEGSFLIVLSVLKLPSIFRALRSTRRNPYLVMCIAYAGMFVVAFSSFANFGLLVRERVQLFPFLLVLLTIPTQKAARQGETNADELART